MRVLFLCTQNACRSQMAEHWARHLFDDRVVAASAGTHPARPHPIMLAVMEEAGVSVAGARSKHLDELAQSEWDLVVTLCDSAAETCPSLPGSRCTLHRPFPDPARTTGTAAEITDAFRHVRDQIREFVLELPSLVARTA